MIPIGHTETLVIGPSGSRKTNYLLNSIQKDNNIIDKIHLCAKKSNMDDIYENIEDYNRKIKRKVLIVFDDMISQVVSNKKSQQVLKELFIRCGKLNISLCFLTQCYFSVPNDVRLNCTHYIIFKLNNKRELQNIAINHSSDIDYEDFVKIYGNCTKEPHNFFDY